MSAPGDDTSATSATAGHYDAVPYPNVPHQALHISRLCATARLFGLPAADAEHARVLDIGCASGGHLVPLAAAFPKAEFLGVDLSPVQIGLGRERVARTGLRNLRLEACSFTDLPIGEGPFDYIICHGVYSWIPHELRAALMDCCKALLAPAGIAAVSYNVLPGWRALQAIRDSVILHAGGIPQHAERMAATRRLLEILVEHDNPDSVYSRSLSSAAKTLLPLPDAYLAHELFETNNTPVTFTEFNATALEHGLCHLAEARFSANIPETLDGQRGPVARTLAQGELFACEQYLDILTGRTFRASLLVHEEAIVGTDRALPAMRFAPLHYLAESGTRVERASDGWQLTKGEGQVAVDLQDEVIAEAVSRLLARHPASSRVDDLLPADASADLRNRLVEVLRVLACEGLVDPVASPVDCATSPGVRPEASELVRSDAAAGLEYTSTLRHAPWKISPQARLLLPLLDGSRERAALGEALLEAALAAGVQIAVHGQPVTDRDRLLGFFGRTVDDELARYAAAGLLKG